MQRHRRPACVLAQDSNDCGPAALATVARFYGRRIGLAGIRTLAGTSRQGTSLSGLTAAAGALGFNANWGLAKPNVIDHVPLPAILHMAGPGAGHFTVACRLNAKWAVLADPAAGVQKIARDSLMARWSGYLMVLEPGADFLKAPTTKPPAIGLLKLALSEPRALILAATLALALNGASFAAAAAVGKLVDSGVLGHNAHMLVACALGFAGLDAFRSLCELCRYLVLGKLGWRVDLRRGMECVDSILHQPLPYFSARRPGESAAYLADAANIRSGLTGPVLSMALDLSLLTVCMGVLSAYEPEMALILLACLPIAALVAFRGAERVQMHDRENRSAATELCARLVDAVGCVCILRAFAAVDRESDRIGREYNRAQAANFRSGVAAAAASGLSSLGGTACLAAVLGLGGSLALVGRASVGEIVFFLSLSGVLLGPLERAGASIAAVQEAIVGEERISELTSLPREDAAPAKLAAIERPAIEIRDLSYSFIPGIWALQRISLTIEPAEFITIVGETGAGKSTLALILAGLLRPTSGTVLLGGEPAGYLQLRQLAAIVPQDGLVLTGSITENIALGDPAASMERIRESAEYACAAEFISRLPNEYNYQVGSGISGLSRGQCQRIAIARALLCNPQILILDEATSALDPATEQRIMTNIRQQRARATTVFATHRLALASQSDRVIVLGGGRVTDSGRHADLLRRQGFYTEMLRAQGTRQAGEPA